MLKYIGVKEVTAEPQVEGGFVKAGTHGGVIARDGYKVVYEDGYTSWSPKEVFEKAYRSTEGMTFGLAIEALKLGKKVARKGWNGANMYCYLVQGSTFKVDREPLMSILGEGTVVNYRPHIDLKTADGSVATWSPSGSDALAEDWMIV
jgi:hypothetical protein